MPIQTQLTLTDYLNDNRLSISVDTRIKIRKYHQIAYIKTYQSGAPAQKAMVELSLIPLLQRHST